MTAQSAVKVAALQYPVEFLETWQRYHDKVSAQIAAATAEGAELLVMPEYASLELVSLQGEQRGSNLGRQLDALQDLLPDYIDLYAALAARHGVYIVAGTFPVRLPNGRCRNRALLFSPTGDHDFQDKLQLTRFEREHSHIEEGDDVKVFDTAIGRIAVCVCYDCEFPLLVRRQVESGADIVLVPSCTDTLAGYYRVKIGCRARALENQCYVVQSATIGEAQWCQAIDINIGAAGIYTPVDRGFPDDGIAAIGQLNTSQWVYATLDREQLSEVCRNGDVLNHRDWNLQYPLAARQVTTVVF